MHTSLFLSYATPDKLFVKPLRIALENLHIPVWMDERELSAGDGLSDAIKTAIQNAQYLLVVFTQHSINSEWVLQEIDWAQENGLKVIPLCFPEVKHTLVKRLLGQDSLIIEHDPAQALSMLLPKIRAALGEQLPAGDEPSAVTEAPLNELLLKLYDPQENMDEQHTRRFAATAELIHQSAQGEEMRSQRFRFIAPLGVIEREELRWYLEHYFLWPVGVFKERGEQVERALPKWGQALHQAALFTEHARQVAQSWRNATGTRRFSIEIDESTLDGSSEEQIKIVQEAATELLALPWELLHDGTGWLFQGKHPAQVRRRLPNHASLAPASPLHLPIRVLLISARPEQDGVGYLDHRASAQPLQQALAALGDLAELSVLSPPTFPAMQTALQQAERDHAPFHVIHFDGHGVYDRRRGLGALCFEQPADADKLEQRRMALIYADDFAAVLRDYRIPLVFLEACQTAQSEAQIEASVAGRLLQKGVSSVVAMTHSVLVETARRFVAAFYTELAQGARVGRAMLAGQRALHDDRQRGRIPGAGALHLQDWFVPVLYQERHDPQLFQQLLPAAAQRLLEQQQRIRLGDLPDPPPHEFVGRSRDLLALERGLATQAYLVLRGQGGAGKTTLACELARWLVCTRRFQRTLFVSLEDYQHHRAVLDSLGRQLLPRWSVAEHTDESGLQQVQRALQDAPCLLVIDNCESLLDDLDTWQAIAALLHGLQRSAPDCRLLFTSRECLPAPFADSYALGALSRSDALSLLGQVLDQQKLPLPAPDSPDYDASETQLTQLVESLHYHARALVLLAPELARRNIHELTLEAADILATLDQQHPGDRENSLYASIELSLRRLPAALRDLLPGLSVFHGGANTWTMMQVLDIDKDSALQLCGALIAVGLAEDAGYGYLRLDPALPVYLHRQVHSDATLAAQQHDTWRPRYLEAMEQLVGFLYQQYFKDAQISAQLTLRELPNLYAFIQQRQVDLSAGDYSPQQAINLSKALEDLLASLSRPQVLQAAVKLREQASALLQDQDWSHAHFTQMESQMDRLLEQGALPAALKLAKDLVQACEQAGTEAYPGAAYDLAMAHLRLGRVLRIGGVAQEALVRLAQAQTGFEALAAHNASAARMVSACLTERGDCLTALGQWQAAVQIYQEAIQGAEKLENKRQVAVGKIQLATVYRLQGDHFAALAEYQAARELFSQLNEAGSVAVAWHQMGMVYQQMQQWDEAEQAYRQSLHIKLQNADRQGEANSLGELGNLYGEQGRLEEAVKFYRQAADIYVLLEDLRSEGVVRSNIADKLIQLQRYAEARVELLRTIECKQAYGHTAEPWKTWAILYDLEQAEGHTQPALQAKAKAVAAYLAYRRDGGENSNFGGQLCAMVLQALQAQHTAEAVQQLQATTQQLAGLSKQQRAALAKPEQISSLEYLLTSLQAVLNGERDPALATDPVLYFDDAAELQWLLEQIAGLG